jgi:glycosyltransferase involved in cell wall biosynthesis
MNDYTVSVVVPGFNESATIEALFRGTHAVMKGLGKRYEFIFVDDGSVDETSGIVEALRLDCPSFLFARHGKNRGKTRALMTGFSLAKGDVIVCMDADLQDLPGEIPKFLQKIEEGYDMVGGWRKHRSDGIFKILLSRCFNSLAGCFTFHRFRDINCGFKAFTREVAACFQLSGDMHRLMPAIAVHNGFSFFELEIKHGPRQYGESRYPLFRSRGLLDLIAYTFRNTVNAFPFCSSLKTSLHRFIAASLTMLCVIFW